MNAGTPVVSATVVSDANVVPSASAKLVRNCRDCDATFTPSGPNTSTRESFRCAACNKSYEENFISNTIKASCSVM